MLQWVVATVSTIISVSQLTLNISRDLRWQATVYALVELQQQRGTTAPCVPFPGLRNEPPNLGTVLMKLQQQQQQITIDTPRCALLQAYIGRGSSLLELNGWSVFSVTDLWRWHDLLNSCVEIDYLLIQIKIMFHLIQRFHIQINEICLWMVQFNTVYAKTLNKETISQSKLSCELYS